MEKNISFIKEALVFIVHNFISKMRKWVWRGLFKINFSKKEINKTAGNQIYGGRK